MKLWRIIIFAIFILAACTGKSRLNASTCEEPGTIGSDRVTDPTQGFDISFQYYLPPCYEQQINARFPVIYLITMPFESSLHPNDNFPMSLADRLIHAEKMAPAIIIVPKDTVAQGYHAALAIDLVSYVDENYNPIRDPRYRGVGGISHGGGIASRMALQFPNIFGSLGVLSGGIATTEKEAADEWIAAIPTRNLPRIRIDVGEQDGIMPITHNLVEVLDRNQTPYTLNVETGNHNWNFWSPRMESYLLWFAEAWK